MSVSQLAEQILNHLVHHYNEHGVTKFDSKSLAGYFETDHEMAEQAMNHLHENGHVDFNLDGTIHVTDKGINQLLQRQYGKKRLPDLNRPFPFFRILLGFI
ncbi:MAG: hypothetical protein K9K39_04855 [Desulfohalobiaceae bacterium]|nr:hypothetical protein [Desulfohalobiaceae bacterium]